MKRIQPRESEVCVVRTTSLVASSRPPFWLAFALAFAWLVGVPERVSSSTLAATEVLATVSPLDSGLVAYWTFDDGTATDHSGRGHDGVLHGCTSVPGANCQAMSFNGSSDYIDFGNPADLNPTQEITVAAWYRPVSYVGIGADPILTKGFTSHSPPYYQYSLYVVGDQYWNETASFSFKVSTGGGEHRVSTPQGFWAPGLWYYVVGTYNGSQLQLYVNAVRAGSEQLTGSLDVYPSSALAGKYNNLPNYLPGTIDEIRVYDRALHPAEIYMLYHLHGAPTPDCPLPTDSPSPPETAWLQFPPVVRGPVTFEFSLGQAGSAGIELFDVRGRLVSRIFAGAVVGSRTVLWDPQRTPSGVYWVRLSARSGHVLDKRLLLVR